MLPAIKWQYIVKLEEGKVFYIGPLFLTKKAALGDLRPRRFASHNETRGFSLGYEKKTRIFRMGHKVYNGQYAGILCVYLSE
jgi:hypothetical protein